MTLKFRVETSEVKQAIGDLAKKVENPREVMQEIGDIISEDIRHRIAKTKKDPNDKPWAPWKPSTAKARERKGNAALGLLYDSGKLLRSITSEVKNHGSKGGWSVYIGTNVPYAPYLNDGTEKMVARPFLGVSARAQDSIKEAINIYLVKDNKK